MLVAGERFQRSSPLWTTGEIVGFAFARERHMKDCMASRGYKYVPKKRKKIEYNR